MHRIASLAACVALAALAPRAVGQTPPPPAYPTITLAAPLPAGTYQLVPATDSAARDARSARDAARIAKIRALAQQILDATAADPRPDPTPDPPAANGKVFVVVVETPAGAPTRGQLFADPALTAYMKIRGNHFRIVDASVIGPDGKTPADVAPYIALAAGKTLPQAFIVDPTGRLLYRGDLPATADALIALLKKVGG